ncbi:MAG: hypothetical protein ACE5HI_15390 [bacterium]
MSNRQSLIKRIHSSAENTLYHQGYVSPLDVLMGIGFLQPVHVKDWRNGKIPYLEKVIQANLNKISFAMKCFRQWAAIKGLKPSMTTYLAKTRGPKKELRFCKSGSQAIEKAYRTHYVDPKLSEKKQERIQKKLEEPPELVVFAITKSSHCSKCEKEIEKKGFLYMEDDKPFCMKCAGFDDLVFLPRGDAAMTRQAKKLSSKYAVVLQYSRTRKRYERQGLFVEEEALEKASEARSGGSGVEAGSGLIF